MRFSVGDHCEFEVRIGAESVSAFAELSGDFNPVHMDESVAARTPAGGRVVHGMLLSSYVSTMIGMHLPGAGALWAKYDVDFLGKVRIGDQFTLRAVVTKITPAAQMLDLSIEGFRDKHEKVLAAKARVLDLSSDDVPVSPLVQQSKPVVAKQDNPAASSQTKATVASADSGNAVLITGGSGVIGQAIAQILLNRGQRVVLWGQNPEKLLDVKGLLQNENPAAKVFTQSVALQDSAQVSEALAVALENVGPIQHFVHLAQPSVGALRVDAPEFPALLKEHLDVGVLGFANVASQLIPEMIRLKLKGTITAILTQYVFDAPPDKVAAYVASKSALWGLIKAIAVEAAPKGVRANAVSPGMINSPYSANVPVRLKQLDEATTPVRRLCLPEDVASAVAYLTSDHAQFLNGVNLPLTGGKRMP